MKKELDTVEEYILLLLFAYGKPLKCRNREDCIRKISYALLFLSHDLSELKEAIHIIE